MEKEKHGTASQQVTGWYVEFQMAVLRALPRDINQEVADGWRENGEALAKNLRGVLTKPELLAPLGTVIVSATAGKFITRDRFVMNTEHNAPVKIVSVGRNFLEWFLGKIEEPATETILHYARLAHVSVDGPIIVELGDIAETTLSQIYALMKRQRNGEDGVLLNKDYQNIFYVRDVNLALHPVSVGWGGDGWFVGASSVEGSRSWNSGDRVFSRNY